MLENETEVNNRHSQLFWPCEDTAREQPSIKKNNRQIQTRGYIINS